MKQFLFFVFGVLTSICSNAQTNGFSEANKQAIVETDCHGKLFVKTEEPPHLKISTQAFADSLRQYLEKQKVKRKKQSVTFSFVVTSKAAILDLRKASGDVRKQKAFEEAIVHFADQWLPAKQNGYVVCSYVKLNLDETDDALRVQISQGD